MKRVIEDLYREFTKEPPRKVRRIIAIDMIELLEYINNAPPDSIARLNSIILHQPQYDVVVEEWE